MSEFHPEAFGKYYLVDKIATGGMAEIFKAKTYSHGGFENLLVIKRILSHLGDNEEFVEMFIDEAKVSVALQHANIIRIYDFGKILDNYFIAMECVDGKDVRAVLRKLAKSRRFLPIEFAAFIAHEACRGLYYAHSKTDLHGQPYGIVHRDISPSNVLVSYEGEIKVADFGIAKAEQNTYNTADGILKGKFEYMSPEQARGESIDHRSDIFSLGIILYEMLTGRRLFKTGSDTATLEKIKTVDIKPPSQLNARVPERLERIVMRALTTTPEARYQTAKEMQDELLEFLFPATPDAIAQSLARFMQALFVDEIAAELVRLEQGSKVAAVLKDQIGDSPDTWDGQTNTTMADGGQQRRRSLVPLLLVLLLFLVAGVGVSGAVVLGIGFLANPEVVDPTTGVVDLMVMPPAEVTFDGENRGTLSVLNLRAVEPGKHSVVLEADGYERYETEIQVRAGETTRIQQQLVRIEVEAKPPDPPTTRPTERPVVRPTAIVQPARVTFTSDPAGALVLVDNEVVGKTPYTWSRGASGTEYTVELQLSGYGSTTGSVTPRSGETVAFSKTLQKAAAAPGSVRIGIVGGGWAHVYIDGTKLAKTAPLANHPLPAGKHVIRVVNEGNGLDYTETVNVLPGKQVRVNAKPQ